MEFLQKYPNHVTSIMKFGLFHITYAEEATNFLVNFEDSQHSLVGNPDLKIHMNRKINE